MRRTEGKKPYTFYDGPPFATGLPHYGHIAAGTIKDVMTRYATMTGHHCKRRFGWDCHGLPIEYEIDKKYEIKSSLEREEVSKCLILFQPSFRLVSKNTIEDVEKSS